MIQLQYCVEDRAGRGASCSRSALRLAGVAVRPRIDRAGSPGSAWVAANTTTETSDEHEQPDAGCGRRMNPAEPRHGVSVER